MHRAPPVVFSLLLASGCYNEGLNIATLTGEVVVPREAATRTVDVGGTPTEVTDVAYIGPVYLGLYSGLDYGVADFPHPNLGPTGDSFPYGGSTIGDFRYACFEYFTCKLVSGRFTSYDDIIEWFTNNTTLPPVDDYDAPIVTGEYIRQTCFELMAYTSDDEVRILPPDRNGDGNLTEADLDFVENADGDFVGTFELLEQEFYEGMSLWAYMDTPSSGSFTFDSCDNTRGFQQNTYNRQYRGGVQQVDLLNRPFEYVRAGDWSVATPYVWDDPEAPAVLTVDFLVGTDDITEIPQPEDGE